MSWRAEAMVDEAEGAEAEGGEEMKKKRKGIL